MFSTAYLKNITRKEFNRLPAPLQRQILSELQVLLKEASAGEEMLVDVMLHPQAIVPVEAVHLVGRLRAGYVGLSREGASR